MNNRVAKRFRKAVGARTDMPDEEKRSFYQMIKKDYARYGFLHSQNPKPLLNKKERRNARIVAKLKAA
jgi:hypothetical protein